MSELTKRDAEILMGLVDAEIKRICKDSTRTHLATVEEIRECLGIADEQKSIAECEKIFALEDSRP